MGATPEKGASSKAKPSRTTSAKGPSLASIRRNKALSTDGHTVKFLYLILKQFNLKSVDWQLIADKTEMSEGRTARMRFNRFKSQMDKIIQSEELLEAKMEENGEGSKLETDLSKEKVIKYLDQLDIESGEVKSERGGFEEGAQISNVKIEPEIYSTRLPRVKLEANDHLPTLTDSIPNPLPTMIKIEDDDLMEISESRHDANQFLRKSSGFPRYTSGYGTHVGHAPSFGFSGLASRTHPTLVLARNARHDSNAFRMQQQHRRYNTENTVLDPDLEIVGFSRYQPTTLSSVMDNSMANTSGPTDSVVFVEEDEGMGDA